MRQVLSGDCTCVAKRMYRRTSNTYGFYRSTDSGQTWTATPIVTFQPLLDSIVIDPVATSTIYTIGTTNSNVSNFIVKSTDSGTTWTKLKLPNTTLYPPVSFPDGVQVV